MDIGRCSADIGSQIFHEFCLSDISFLVLILDFKVPYRIDDIFNLMIFKILFVDFCVIVIVFIEISFVVLVYYIV